jgi:hypothetical protein
LQIVLLGETNLPTHPVAEIPLEVQLQGKKPQSKLEAAMTYRITPDAQKSDLYFISYVDLCKTVTLKFCVALIEFSSSPTSS